MHLIIKLFYIVPVEICINPSVPVGYKRDLVQIVSDMLQFREHAEKIHSEEQDIESK